MGPPTNPVRFKQKSGVCSTVEQLAAEDSIGAAHPVKQLVRPEYLCLTLVEQRNVC
jgi:hypothetical protein